MDLLAAMKVRHWDIPNWIGHIDWILMNFDICHILSLHSGEKRSCVCQRYSGWRAFWDSAMHWATGNQGGEWTWHELLSERPMSNASLKGAGHPVLQNTRCKQCISIYQCINWFRESLVIPFLFWPGHLVLVIRFNVVPEFHLERTLDLPRCMWQSRAVNWAWYSLSARPTACILDLWFPCCSDALALPVSYLTRNLGRLGTGCSASFPEHAWCTACFSFAEDGCPIVSPTSRAVFEIIWLGHYMECLMMFS